MTATSPLPPSRAERPPRAKRADSLQPYARKRDFGITPEPRATRGQPHAGVRSFVIQKHWASSLHYDFRLALGGVLLSWAVPKGPSLDPRDRRMAIHVEDHPLDYRGFEGTIPPKQYGAGDVIVWDRGHWEPEGDAKKGLVQGKLAFSLHGEKLAGRWEMVRIAKRGDRQEAWLLFKKKDAWARSHDEFEVTQAWPDSVIAKPLGPLEERESRKTVPLGEAAAPESAPAPEVARNEPRRRANVRRDVKASSGGQTSRRTQADDVAPAGARKAALPKTLTPQLATLVKDLPPQGDWSYEVKFDGYRILARIARGHAKLFTRNGHDWTDRMPELARQIEALGLKSAWLDGEVVVLDEEGRSHFNALQNAFETARTAELTYFIFDTPCFEGFDLRSVPLQARRKLLRGFLAERGSDKVRFSDDFPADASNLLDAACAMKLEGLIAKRTDAPYVSQRSDTWLKIKCLQRQEFVIAGFSDRAGRTNGVGSLLLAVHENGALVHAGNVGTGWTLKANAVLRKRLDTLVVATPPIADGAAALQPGRWSRRDAAVHWVKPTLVAEVAFAEWTPEGRVRHASFQALRDDKPARTIKREREQAINTKKASGGRTNRAHASKKSTTHTTALKVTHGERVIDASTGLTKLDLVRYLDSVADWLLPELAHRPVALLRAPKGVRGAFFFQKHDENGSIPGLRQLDAALLPGHPPLIGVPDRDALLAAAQMNVVEFHPWNGRVRNAGRPDRIVFDLDPGEGVGWKTICEAAELARNLLEELGLQSVLKTSGGKGLHVIVPLTPKFEAETTKAFSQAVVQHMAKTIPSRFVAKSGPRNRVGKIFIDYLRNGLGQTTVAAYSPRARPGLGVSMPVSWDELAELKSSAQWTISNARDHLSLRGTDPWAGTIGKRQSLVMPMKRLGLQPPPTARREKPKTKAVRR
ncbi:MAG: DNA ligase D [Burkholderiales bacterium]